MIESEGYKAKIISTIVDVIAYNSCNSGYKAKIISTIVDVDFTLTLSSEAIRPK